MIWHGKIGQVYNIGSWKDRKIPNWLNSYFEKILYYISCNKVSTL